MSDASPRNLTIRLALNEDAEALARIYNHYIRETIITFEEEPLSVRDMESRIERVRAIPLPWLVAQVGNQIVGYAFAKPWKERSAYRFSTETSVFVDPDHRRRGIGSRLYQKLVHELRGLGVHSAIGGIALPNEASVALHEALGFKRVAEFHEVGFKFQKWIDVGYWQKIL